MRNRVLVPVGLVLLACDGSGQGKSKVDGEWAGVDAGATTMPAASAAGASPSAGGGGAAGAPAAAGGATASDLDGLKGLAALPKLRSMTSTGEPVLSSEGVRGLGSIAYDGGADSAPGVSSEEEATTQADPPGISTYCGDGIRGLDEECDDGNSDDGDACTSTCDVHDFLVVAPAAADGGSGVQNRYLGWGRHPVAAGEGGFGVVYVEPHGDRAEVGLTTFEETGVRRITTAVSVGSTPQFFADPVVAKLPGDRYAVAWTDFGGDGDALGVALRTIDGATGALSDLQFANERTFFSQYDADMLWTGNELVVAWVDDADATRRLDVHYRRFDQDLTPLSGQQSLGATPNVESGVSLAAHAGGFAAAWRETDVETGYERTVVTDGTVTWRTQGYVPGPAEAYPALVELDAQHLLLAVAVTTAPNTELEVPQYWFAILDVAAPGDVVVSDVLSDPAEPLSPYIRLYRWGIARAGGFIWAAGGVPFFDGFENDEVGIWRFEWDAATETLTALDWGILPRQPGSRLGDQRFPSLASSSLAGSDAMVAVWDDHYVEDGVQHGEPDVIAQVLPLPLFFNSVDGGAE